MKSQIHDKFNSKYLLVYSSLLYSTMWCSESRAENFVMCNFTKTTWERIQLHLINCVFQNSTSLAYVLQILRMWVVILHQSSHLKVDAGEFSRVMGYHYIESFSQDSALRDLPCGAESHLLLNSINVNHLVIIMRLR